jgi:hypothetical protein
LDSSLAVWVLCRKAEKGAAAGGAVPVAAVRFKCVLLPLLLLLLLLLVVVFAEEMN